MKRVFADTHFYLALLNARDACHAQTVDLVRRDEYGQVITTAWVVAELADGMANLRARQRCIRFVEALRRAPKVRIIEVEAQLFWRGFDLYRTRLDKEWSLTDCISFAVMRDEGLNEALTGDRHFEQEGFTALLVR